MKALQIVSNLKVPVCANCGCGDLRVLEVNHRNGGGRKEYKTLLGLGYNMHYAIVKRNRLVDDLEVLCKVCNAKHYVEHKFGLCYQVNFANSNKVGANLNA